MYKIYVGRILTGESNNPSCSLFTSLLFKPMSNVQRGQNRGSKRSSDSDFKSGGDCEPFTIYTLKIY